MCLSAGCGLRYTYLKEVITKHGETAQGRIRKAVLDPEDHAATYRSNCTWMSAEKQSTQLLLDLIHDVHAA